MGLRTGFRAAWCLVGSVILVPVLAGTFTVFSKTYVRSTGAPVTEVDAFVVRDPSAEHTPTPQTGVRLA